MTLTPAEVDAIIAMACALPPQSAPPKTQQTIDDERAIARLEDFIANKAPELIRRHNQVAKEWHVMKAALKRVNELKKRVNDVEGERDTALATLAIKETELQRATNELTALRALQSQWQIDQAELVALRAREHTWQQKPSDNGAQPSLPYTKHD